MMSSGMGDLSASNSRSLYAGIVTGAPIWSASLRGSAGPFFLTCNAQRRSASCCRRSAGQARRSIGRVYWQIASQPSLGDILPSWTSRT